WHPTLRRSTRPRGGIGTRRQKVSARPAGQSCLGPLPASPARALSPWEAASVESLLLRVLLKYRSWTPTRYRQRRWLVPNVDGGYPPRRLHRRRRFLASLFLVLLGVASSHQNQ